MININIEQSQTPIYRQLYDQIRAAISSGELSPGEKLPSKRVMADRLSVSVNTVDGAYSQLVSEGFLESRPKSGFFVCDIGALLTMEDAPAEKPSDTPPAAEGLLVDFSPRDTELRAFPYATWRRLLKSSFGERESLLSPTPKGDPGLRAQIARYLASSRGVRCTADQIIVCGGTDQMLQMLCMILPSSLMYGVENPVYSHAYRILRANSRRVVAIDTDGRGISTAQLSRTNVSCIYITPSHQFPLGYSMPVSRRTELISWASEQPGRFIIEDDYDSEFRYASKPLPSLQSIDDGGNVIYLGTFSRSLLPSVRISYCVLPKSLLPSFERAYAWMTSPVSSLEQTVLAKFIESGSFEALINKTRKLYRQKRTQLAGLLNDTHGELLGESAGHHAVFKLNNGLSEWEMCRRAQEVGVGVYPISEYFLHGVPEQYESSVLIGFGGVSQEQLEWGISILKTVWEKD